MSRASRCRAPRPGTPTGASRCRGAPSEYQPLRVTDLPRPGGRPLGPDMASPSRSCSTRMRAVRPSSLPRLAAPRCRPPLRGSAGPVPTTRIAAPNSPAAGVDRRLELEHLCASQGVVLSAAVRLGDRRPTTPRTFRRARAGRRWGPQPARHGRFHDLGTRRLTSSAFWRWSCGVRVGVDRSGRAHRPVRGNARSERRPPLARSAVRASRESASRSVLTSSSTSPAIRWIRARTRKASPSYAASRTRLLRKRTRPSPSASMNDERAVSTGRPRRGRPTRGCAGGPRAGSCHPRTASTQHRVPGGRAVDLRAHGGVHGLGQFPERPGPQGEPGHLLDEERVALGAFDDGGHLVRSQRRRLGGCMDEALHDLARQRAEHHPPNRGLRYGTRPGRPGARTSRGPRSARPSRRRPWTRAAAEAPSAQCASSTTRANGAGDQTHRGDR